MLCIRLTSVLGVVLLAAATPAIGQVTVDLHALQALPERAAPAPAPRRVAPPTRVAPSAEALSAPAPSASASAPSMPTPPAPQPALPQNVPSVATISPVPPPSEAAPPPPPPTVSDTASTKAEPESKGMRILFGAGSSDLSPDSVASLRQLSGTAPQNDSTYNVAAYAPGNRDDPSTARRLSLARAMAVRSALIASGVPSNHIYVRALGDAYGSGSADRVDVTMAGANADSTAQAGSK